MLRDSGLLNNWAIAQCSGEIHGKVMREGKAITQPIALPSAESVASAKLFNYNRTRFKRGRYSEPRSDQGWRSSVGRAADL
jgi:hypothetical protein